MFFDAELEAQAGYEFYLMRHGIAAARTGTIDDFRRKLTPEGRDKMEKIAQGLRRLGVGLDWIVTSPVVRAVETAEIVAKSLPAKVPMDMCDELRPGKSHDDLLIFLGAQPERKRILLVGHEPDLSLLAGRLIGAGRNCNLGFKKGGCCLIRAERMPPRSQGHLIWWLTPRICRYMA